MARRFVSYLLSMLLVLLLSSGCKAFTVTTTTTAPAFGVHPTTQRPGASFQTMTKRVERRLHRQQQQQVVASSSVMMTTTTRLHQSAVAQVSDQVVSKNDTAFAPAPTIGSTADAESAAAATIKRSRTSSSSSSNDDGTAGLDDNSSNSNSNYAVLLDLNQALNALAEQAGAATSGTDAIQAAVRAEQLYQSRARSAVVAAVDLVSFNTVLKAWARACQTLAELHGRPTRVILNTNNSDKKQESATITASTSTHSLLLLRDNDNDEVDMSHIKVYTARDAAVHAATLLQSQLQLAATATAANVILPDTTSYNSVMDAWSKSRDLAAPDQVEELLQQLRERQQQQPHLRPDTFSYNAVVDAYAYSIRPDRLERLHAIWDEMRLLSTTTTTTAAVAAAAATTSTAANSAVRATVRTINSILHAYSKAGLEHPEQAETLSVKVLEIFRDMKDTYKRTNNPSDQPDVVTYTTGACLFVFIVVVFVCADKGFC